MNKGSFVYNTAQRFLQSVFLVLLLMPALCLASGTLNGMRVWVSPEGTRVVFDMDQTPDYKVFMLHNPERVVIDISGVKAARGFKLKHPKGTVIKKIRRGTRGAHHLRFVLDLNKKIESAAFVLPPSPPYGNRLVVDLEDPEKKEILSYFAPERSPKKSHKFVPKHRDMIIAIDAGHGGEDPGAIGPAGTFEKNVVLSIAKKLSHMVNSESGMRSFLVRRGDYYIPLRKRMKIARANGADLFISVHADGFKDPKVRGASVFVLSERGASSEAARWLAAKENNSDFIGGVQLDKNDDVLASVLLDLSQTASSAASAELGNLVLKSMGNITKLHKPRVEHAGFMVLKSPDTPSILVEVGFISNPKGEKRLRQSAYQKKMATAIMKGIRHYAARHPRPMVAMR